MPCPFHSPWIDHPNTIRGEACKSWSSSICSLIQPFAMSSLFGPNILLSTLFTDTSNVWSSLRMKDQNSHLYKTTGVVTTAITTITTTLKSVSSL
jgi:hypothetical protein